MSVTIDSQEWHASGSGNVADPYLSAQGALIQLVSVSVTRPADTTQYTAGDRLSNSTTTPTELTATVARHNAGKGIIIGAHLICSESPTIKPDIDLLVFDTSVGAGNDNAAFLPSNTQLETYLGCISFLGGAFKSLNSNGVIPGLIDGGGLAYKTGASVQTLYLVPILKNAYTPTSGAKYTFRFSVEQY